MNFSIKRPKRFNQEDEDELLRFQEEFLKNKSVQQPAAKLVRHGSDTPNQTTSNLNSKPQEKLELDFDADNQALKTVLTDIIEKPFPNDWIDTNSAQNEFIGVEKIDLSLIKSKPDKNKSLFAQNLELKGRLKSHYPLDKVHQPKKLLEKDERLKLIEKNLSSVKKPLITGEGLGNTKDVEQIHIENIELLAQMTPDQIIAEQNKLIQQLDPKLVAFIRKRSDLNPSGDEFFPNNQQKPQNRSKIERDEIWMNLTSNRINHGLVWKKSNLKS